MDKIFNWLIVIILFSSLRIFGQEFAMHHAETIYYEMHDCDSIIFTGACEYHTEPKTYLIINSDLQTIELNAKRLNPSSLTLTVTTRPWWATSATEEYRIQLLRSLEVYGTFNLLPIRKPTTDEVSHLNLILSNLVISKGLDQPKLSFEPGEFGQK